MSSPLTVTVNFIEPVYETNLGLINFEGLDTKIRQQIGVRKKVPHRPQIGDKTHIHNKMIHSTLSSSDPHILSCDFRWSHLHLNFLFCFDYRVSKSILSTFGLDLSRHSSPTLIVSLSNYPSSSVRKPLFPTDLLSFKGVILKEGFPPLYERFPWNFVEITLY